MTALPRSGKQGQERRVQMGEEAVGGGGRGGNGGGGEQAAGEAGRLDCEIFVKMDSHVLDCTICCESLRPPIYQCEVGHAVCFACRGKLCNTCPFCCRGIGFCRCFALEQVVDTVKVPCSNANYGCKQMAAHSKDQQDRFSITLSPSTNGCRQTSTTTRPRGSASHGTAASQPWSGRTGPCFLW
uniref:RING-type domain-containing protein n=1 Tax=Setaria viridis TaxID=4556 RepID=A0A4U6UEG3_SETVI|nr:hypothetical protein SEVIR_5G082800v2 [Setaria viridis]